jgi:Na+/melibiose symporter-like transporter
MRHIPGGVRALGFVSTFSDASSEMIHSLLPIFLVTVLGVSATAIGTLEGIAEATVLVVKMFSGTLSDWFGRQKPTVRTTASKYSIERSEDEF